MCKQLFSSKASGFVIAMLLVFPAASLALDPPPEEDAPLDEITVTATRRAESISNVPISISALSQVEMDEQRLNTVEDVFRTTPGVRFRTDNLGNSLSIRGISSNIGAGTTGVYIDDTPIQIRSAPLSFTGHNAYPGIFDLERVEVLRGPQGTLFGAGSIGGAARFLLPQPNLFENEFYGKTGIGFTRGGDPTYEAGFAGGGPIQEGKLGYRISANYREQGGYVDYIPWWIAARNQGIDESNCQPSPTGCGGIDGGTGSKDANTSKIGSYRLALTWAPTDALRITPAIYYQDSESFNGTDFWDFYSDPDDDVYVDADATPWEYFDEWLITSLAINYDFESFSVISNTSIFDRDNDNLVDITPDMFQLTPAGTITITPTQFLPGWDDFAVQGFDLNEQEVFTQELRFQSNNPDSAFSWVAGVFYQDTTTNAQAFAPISPERFDRMSQLLIDPFTGENYSGYLELFWGVPLMEGDQSYQTFDNIDEQQIAGFFEGSYAFSGGLSVTAGVRYAEFDIEHQSEQGGPLAGSPVMFGHTSDTEEDATTYKFTVGYQPNDDNLFYVSASDGFRPGGLNSPLPAVCDIAAEERGISEVASWESDTADSFELGSKNILMDGRLSVFTSIYKIEWENIPASFYLGLGCNRSTVLNVASATSEGGDLTASMAISDKFGMTANIGFTKTVYNEPLLGRPDATGEPTIVINKGNSVGSMSPWTTSLTADYNTTVFGNESFARMTYTYSAGQDIGTSSMDPATTSYSEFAEKFGSSDRLGLQLGTFIGNAQVVFYVDNLTDERTILQTGAGDVADRITRSRSIRPRTFGFSLIYRNN